MPRDRIAIRPGRGKTAGSPIVRLQRNYLQRLADDRKYHDWLPTAIDAPGADPVMLRRYGFDVLVDDRKSDPARIKSAIDKGFFLMPRLSGISAKTDPQQVLAEVDAYPHKEAVAFWQIGEGLGRKREIKTREEELSKVRQVVTAMRQLPAEYSRLTTAEVDGDLPLYSRAPGNLDTIGIQPLLWASVHDPAGRPGVSQSTAAADGACPIPGASSGPGFPPRHRRSSPPTSGARMFRRHGEFPGSVPRSSGS